VQRARIVNVEGLHARPCHAVVSLAREFEADLLIRNGETEVNGRSILELMTLSASCGDELELKAEGEDALALLEALSRLIAAGFTEMD
jgi:phosphocarrier protein HPr